MDSYVLPKKIHLLHTCLYTKCQIIIPIYLICFKICFIPKKFKNFNFVKPIVINIFHNFKQKNPISICHMVYLIVGYMMLRQNNNLTCTTITRLCDNIVIQKRINLKKNISTVSNVCLTINF